MRFTLLLVVTLLFASNNFAFHPIWRFMDKRLIKEIARLDLDDPKSVEAYFKKRNEHLEREKLGFSWKVWSTGKAAGTISIRADFYYYNDSLVGYKIFPELPDEKKQIKRYQKWYGSQFKYFDLKINPFEYNCEAIYSPLDSYYDSFKEVTISEKMKLYMSPESGTAYGYRGGYSGAILPNRSAFLALKKDSLTTEQVRYLMYAKNPTSRFTAMEWYLQNRSAFSDTILLDEWMDLNFKEIPVSTTTFGCLIERWSSEDLVYMLSQVKIEE